MTPHRQLRVEPELARQTSFMSRLSPTNHIDFWSYRTSDHNMVDPLSVGAGIAGVISLSIQVTPSLVKIFTPYNDQNTNKTRKTKKLETHRETFSILHT